MYISYALSRSFAHTTLAWIGKILSWKLKAYALMPTKMAMILSWEFYSDWYHMHDESSLIWVAFYVVIEYDTELITAVAVCVIWFGWWNVLNYLALHDEL